MKLFSKEIDKKLFSQYSKGSDLDNQVVVTKIFNPYGNGRWFLLNSDPQQPDYLWAIVQMGDVVEMGSVLRSELESVRVSPFRFPLERDLSFRMVNAGELFRGLQEGKFYKKGGFVNGYAKGGIVYLESVGTYLRTSDMSTSPMEDFKNEGEINSVNENSDEWWDSLSQKDKKTIEEYNTKHSKKSMAKGGHTNDLDIDSLVGKKLDDGKIIRVKDLGNDNIWVVRENFSGLVIEQGFTKDDIIKLLKGEKVEGLQMMAQGGELNLGIRKIAEQEGFTPKQLGKEYELVMAQAIVESLTDANFHNEARKLISLLENKPEWENKPEYGTKEYEKWEKSGVYNSKYWDADEKTRDFAIKVSQKSGWDGYAIASAFEYLVRIDGGYHKLADKIEKAMESNEKMADGGIVKKYAIVDENTDRIYIKNTNKEFIDLKFKELKEVYPNDKLSIVEFAHGGYMAKGGGIYTCDSLYYLQVIKDDKEVAREKFRAKSLKEAKEISEEEYEEDYIKKYGNPLNFIVSEAMEDGGKTLESIRKEIDERNMKIRFKIALVIGIDKALKYLDMDYVISPFKLIEASVSKGFITIDEIDENIWRAARIEADEINDYYRGSGEGIGSSDINAFVSNMLNEAGIKVSVVDGRYTRMSEGGEVDSEGKRLADNPNWTNDKLRVEYDSLKKDLQNFNSGLLKPSKVIGTGYKSSAIAKRLAKKWLEDNVAKYEKALEIRGVMADGGEIDSEATKKSFNKGVIDVFAEDFVKKLKTKGINATKKSSKNGVFIYGEKRENGKYKYETYLSYSELPNNEFLELEESEFLRMHKIMAKGGKLIGNQKKLDVNKNGKLDAEDFKMLRGKKMAMGGYVVIEGFDHYKNKPLYQVVSRDKDSEFVGVWHTLKEDAENEYKSLVGNWDDEVEIMAMGGKVKFADKVKEVKASLLKRKKVSPKVQKDYGKTYSPKEAEQSAKRIIGAQVKKYEVKKKFKKGGKTIAQTPAPSKDRVYGSSKNKVGSASSQKSAMSIKLDEDIVKTLTNKAKEYNENHSSKVSTSTLKAVMRRGMGAYSTSHRPTISGGAPNSRQAWGFARVNKFLLKKGGTKVKKAYVQDDDLLK